MSVTGPIKAPLKVSQNPNYFADATGRPIVLCGSHTWNNLQDWGQDGVPQPLDFEAYVDFLLSCGHNFTLLWVTELPKFRRLPTTAENPPDFTVTPFPWQRTGPGVATDGLPAFDLTKFNPEYFERLRARVETLNRAGIYVGVYPFSAEWLLRFRFEGDGYPFSGPNNVNGIDDGYRGDSPEAAVSSVTMTKPNAITALQEVYVRKLVDTLNDLPNVLWIVSQEGPPGSTWWNAHMIAFIREYERTKPWQHPIGYGSQDKTPDTVAYNSDADWVAPWTRISPPVTRGRGTPARKVVINDSDHSYWSMWNDTAQQNRNYAWQNFLNGNQVVFMDPYVVHYPRQDRNLPPAPVHGISQKPDARWDGFRANLGFLVSYSRRLNLANVTPQPELSSTKFCLAQTPAVGAEYLIYAPNGGPFTVDLSAMPPSRQLSVEWFEPATGQSVPVRAIPAGSSAQEFKPPFRGDAVLYLVDAAGHK